MRLGITPAAVSQRKALLQQQLDEVRALLVEIQHQLFNLGGELSIPGFELLKAEAVLALDEALATYNSQLPKLQEFILPAGSRAASSPNGVTARIVPMARSTSSALSGAGDGIV